MNKDSRALLPCPFCGGEVKMTYEGSSDWIVECKSCPVETNFWVDAKKFGYGEGEAAEARRRWNTRQASRQSLEGQEPVVWALQWPNETVNWMTTYPTKERAEEYASKCLDGKSIKIVPLFTTPPSAIEIRNGALEEAAKICDKSAADLKESRTVHEAWCGYADTGCMVCASLIRDIIKPSGER